jgi:hypothetical protein
MRQFEGVAPPFQSSWPVLDEDEHVSPPFSSAGLSHLVRCVKCRIRWLTPSS